MKGIIRGVNSHRVQTSGHSCRSENMSEDESGDRGQKSTAFIVQVAGSENGEHDPLPWPER